MAVFQYCTKLKLSTYLIVYRSTRESYGDSAIGYVKLLRQENICLVKGQICPEHRVRQKNYKVALTVDEEEEKIVDVNCDDCAASLGKKHILY